MSNLSLSDVFVEALNTVHAHPDHLYPQNLPPRPSASAPQHKFLAMHIVADLREKRVARSDLLGVRQPITDVDILHNIIYSLPPSPSADTSDDCLEIFYVSLFELQYIFAFPSVNGTYLPIPERREAELA